MLLYKLSLATFKCHNSTWSAKYVNETAILGIPDSPQYAEDPDINRKVSIFGADMTSLKVDGIVRSTDTSLTSDDGSKS